MIEKKELDAIQAAAGDGIPIHLREVVRLCSTIRALWKERTSWEKRYEPLVKAARRILRKAHLIADMAGFTHTKDCPGCEAEKQLMAVLEELHTSSKGGENDSRG